MDYEKLHKDTIAKLQEMVNSGKITVKTACGICADFVPESEDERIRKELLEHCINRRDGKQVCVDESDYRRWADWLFRQGVENITNVKSDKEISNEIIKFLELPHPQFVGKRHQEKWIAWLERQGEYKTIDEIAKEVCKDKASAVAFLKSAGIMNEKGELAEQYRQDEQKPADNIESSAQNKHWSEEDEKMINDILMGGEHLRYLDTANIAWLKSIKDRVQPQPKQEWSEKDEIALADALWCCKQAASIAKDENDMGNVWYAETWLKSLKDKVQLQQKEKWSEKDSPYYDDICEILINLLHSETADVNKDAVQKDLDWLNSLLSGSV